MDNLGNDPTVHAGSDDLSGKKIGRFQIIALLGKGGMGEVYLAEDSLLKRSVALKRVSASLRANPHYRELLIKEAERASRLNDEHVARVHDVMEHAGEVFLVMEYVEGRSLRHRTGTPMPVSEFLPIAVQCAEALVAAHQSGIVHRDLKPENIMISTNGRVKVCDFGLARQGAWNPDTTILDRTPTVAFRGTPAYMAPEALLCRDPDFRADMFSLGIVFYELLAGTHPFREANNQVATTDRIIHASPTPLGQFNISIPKGLAGLIEKMLRKDPVDRYGDPQQLLADLRSVTLPEPATGWTYRPHAALVLLVIVLIAAAAILRLDRGLTIPRPSQRRNLVVLPFRSINENPEARFYVDGLTDTITARLSRMGDDGNIQVAPVIEVRAKEIASAEEARKQLSADLILAGSLQQSDSTSRFTYSLYDAATLRQLTADTIVTASSDAFALEDQLIDRIEAALVPSPTPKTTNPKSRTPVAAAYDLYVQGRGYFQDQKDASHLQTAVQSFQRAAELDPGYATAYAALGQAYWAKYEATKEPVWVELARQACDRADDLDPRSVDAKLCLGVIDSGLGQYEKAVGDFEEALELDSSNDAAYLGLGTAHEQLGNYPAAERTFRRAIELKPNYYLAYSRLGDFYRRRARYTEAAEQFQKEIRLIPNSERPYLAVGAAYIYAGRYDDAITVLQKSIELRPTAAAYSNLGSTYSRLRRFDDAIPIFEQAVKRFPRNFIFAGNLARAYYWSTNQREKAAPAYLRVIELASEDLGVNPRHADAHIMLARYYAMIARKNEALQHLTQALTLRPSEAEYFSIAAVVHNQLGNRSSALEALRKAVSLGWSKAEIQTEVEFDNLRKDPNFERKIQP